MTTAANASKPTTWLVPWLFLATGWAGMYGPTYWKLSQTLWRTDEYAHGAIVLLLVVWMLWQCRHRLVSSSDSPRPALGIPLFVFGALVYVTGRSQDILLFEIGSQIPVLAGSLLIMHGLNAVRVASFPLLYIAFMIPLPSILVDFLTGPLKQWVSVIAETALYGVGYPIARTGVILTIGQYQLLVADACSGLHSMFSLAALGLLFMYLIGRRSRLHSVVMLASIFPIAFAANVLRVIILVLVTYHFGDAAGQGFLHDFAGVALLVAALTILFALDSALVRLMTKSGPR